MTTQTTSNVPATQGAQAPANRTPIDRLKAMLATPSVEQQFKNALKDSTPLFVASLIDLYGGDSHLQKCEPKEVIMEALKAATLKLPINKSLGFAYIVPYKKNGKQVPTFQIGYKGLIQLAMRTGVYSCINADVVYEGELVKTDKLTGHMDLSGKKKSDTIVGFFAHFETVNGFKKTVYITVDDVKAHAKKFSASYDNQYSPWKTNFEAMAIKTPLRHLLGKYGIMSVEMEQAFTNDRDDEPDQPPPAGPNEGDVIDAEYALSGNEGGNGNGTEVQQAPGPDF
jgi:recombination protein RecT